MDQPIGPLHLTRQSCDLSFLLEDQYTYEPTVCHFVDSTYVKARQLAVHANGPGKQKAKFLIRRVGRVPRGGARVD